MAIGNDDARTKGTGVTPDNECARHPVSSRSNPSLGDPVHPDGTAASVQSGFHIVAEAFILKVAF
jgi:hypothetical protein